jgi:hypothetical protein
MAGISNEEIDQRFGYRYPYSEEIKRAHAEVRLVLVAAAKLLVDLVPAGREQSLMVTHLEEACYWANNGITRSQQVGE